MKIPMFRRNILPPSSVIKMEIVCPYGVTGDETDVDTLLHVGTVSSDLLASVTTASWNSGHNMCTRE
jgi:hypothetical protein